MISILRLSHRIERDKRLTTHCALVARAFGAREMIYSGDRDQHLEESIQHLTKEWGGKFSVRYEKNWLGHIKHFRGLKIHLTMYGLPLQKKIGEIRKRKNLLIIIGSEKVPGEVMHLADYNVSVGSQPHSEVAALAILLDRYFSGKELEKKFPNWKRRIIPQRRGKKILRR